MRKTYRFQQFIVPRNSACVYFCSGVLDLEQVTLAKCKQLVIAIDDYPNL